MRNSKTYLASESWVGAILRRVEKYNQKIKLIYKNEKSYFLHFSEVDTATCQKIDNLCKRNTNSMYILVYLRYNENKRSSNSRKAVMPTGQRYKGNLEKVNSLLTSGEDVLISDAHIIKNGTPAIAPKVLATLYKEMKQLH